MFLELDGRGTRQAQLTRALKDAVLSGRLRSGDRLPATRALASDLGISRNTVLASYEELAAEGFLLGKVGSGSYVAPIETHAPEKAAAPARARLSAFAQRALATAVRANPGAGHQDLPYNLQYGQPMTNPALTTAWRRELAKAAAYTRPEYPQAQGLLDLRTAVCDYLARRRGWCA